MSSSMNVVELVKQCQEEGLDLISEIRMLGPSKDQIFSTLQSLVFDGLLMKADIFYAFGSVTVEFEAAITELLSDSEDNLITNSLLIERLRSSRRQYPFENDDFKFYLSCRDCFTDFQALVSSIERNLWWGTFATLRQTFGKDWIAEIDKNKRKSWAQVREDFRLDQAEAPLFEFCSIPDLRDIITSSKNWPHFTTNLPNSLADKAKITDAFNHTLIPCRNKIFHPTRTLGLTYTEFADLKILFSSVSINRWRNLNLSQMPKLAGTGPFPKWY